MVAPKDINYSKSYDMRIDNTMSKLTQGEMFVEEIFKKLSVPLCEGSSIQLIKKNDKYIKQLETQQNKQYKIKKFQNKAKLIKLNSIP